MLFRVSPLFTIWRTPETGRITSVWPGVMVEPAISLPHLIVLTETPNILAIWDRESPSLTTYILIWSEVGWSYILSLNPPIGLPSARRAESPTMVISPPPLGGFGSMFNAA